MALGVRDMPMCEYEEYQIIPMYRYNVNSHNADSKMKHIRKYCYNSINDPFAY